MVVGTTYIDYNKINTFVGHPSQFKDWVDSLVPCWAKHIEGIIDNQRYYIAIHLRQVISIPYVQRMELINPLIENIKIKGSVDGFVAITDILALCDTKVLVEALKEEFGYG